MKDRLVLDKAPSSGAVSAIFKKWEEWGFAEFRQNPFAFLQLSIPARIFGIQGFIAEMKDAQKQGITPELVEAVRMITSGQS